MRLLSLEESGLKACSAVRFPLYMNADMSAIVRCSLKESRGLRLRALNWACDSKQATMMVSKQAWSELKRAQICTLVGMEERYTSQGDWAASSVLVQNSLEVYNASRMHRLGCFGVQARRKTEKTLITLNNLQLRSRTWHVCKKK